MARYKSRRGNRQKRISDANAPYNFVPLPDKVFYLDDHNSAPEIWKSNDVYLPSRFSGWFNLTILTETPTFIRCGPSPEHSKPKEVLENPYRQNFFHHGNPDFPVIPGSSIRGMIRTLIEIVCCTKMSFVDNDQYIYRSIAGRDPLSTHYRDIFSEAYKSGRKNIKGGYLTKTDDGWAICPAREDEQGRTFLRVKDKAAGVPQHKQSQPFDRDSDLRPAWIFSQAEEPVKNGSYIVLGEKPPETGKHFVKGTLVRTGPMYKKNKHYVVYEKDEDKELIPIPQEMKQLYQNDTKLSRGLPTRILEKDGDPLFYLVEKELESDKNPAGLRFFGSTMMFRIPYEKSVHDHIPNKLLSSAKIDVAEGLFGTISDDLAIKGRVFFEDAPWDENGDPFYSGRNGRRVPEELSGPKPTTFEHYLEQKSKTVENLKHWDDGGVRIRGYKKYWHKPDAGESDIFRDFQVLGDESQKDRATVIRPVTPNTRFIGRVRFENLNKFELGALWFVFNLPNSMKHNIGMGKPLGMGSISIEAEPYLIDRQKRYSKLLVDSKLVVGYIGDTMSVIQSARQQFHDLMLDHYGGKYSDLWKVPRMQALGALLSWNDAPDRKYTEYMELGQFGEGKVLPNAKDVQEKHR